MMDVVSPKREEAGTRKGKPPRSSGVVVPHAPKWYQQAAAWLIYATVRAVTASLRYRWTDRTGFFKTPPVGPAIYCIWHNRLANCMRAYVYIKARNQTPGLGVWVSASKDGGLLAAVLKCFQVQPVRGSSSRRGRQALLELTTWAERGYDLALTPDGPRGPCYVVQDGVTSLAQLTGLPIVPVSFQLQWKIRSNSWDRFQIPVPFSRCEMIFEQPIHVPRDASDEQREALRQELERTLRAISQD